MSIKRIHPYVQTDDLDAPAASTRRCSGCRPRWRLPCSAPGPGPCIRAGHRLPTRLRDPAARLRDRRRQHPEAVDHAHARIHDRGLRIVYPLTTEPWGVRRFFAEDPNGHINNVLAHPPTPPERHPRHGIPGDLRGVDRPPARRCGPAVLLCPFGEARPSQLGEAVTQGVEVDAVAGLRPDAVQPSPRSGPSRARPSR